MAEKLEYHVHLLVVNVGKLVPMLPHIIQQPLWIRQESHRPFHPLLKQLPPLYQKMKMGRMIVEITQTIITTMFMKSIIIARTSPQSKGAKLLIRTDKK